MGLNFFQIYSLFISKLSQCISVKYKIQSLSDFRNQTSRNHVFLRGYFSTIYLLRKHSVLIRADVIVSCIISNHHTPLIIKLKNPIIYFHIGCRIVSVKFSVSKLLIRWFFFLSISFSYLLFIKCECEIY